MTTNKIEPLSVEEVSKLEKSTIIGGIPIDYVLINYKRLITTIRSQQQEIIMLKLRCADVNKGEIEKHNSTIIQREEQLYSAETNIKDWQGVASEYKKEIEHLQLECAGMREVLNHYHIMMPTPESEKALSASAGKGWIRVEDIEGLIKDSARVQQWIDVDSQEGSCDCNVTEHCRYCTKGTAASSAAGRILSRIQTIIKESKE